MRVLVFFGALAAVVVIAGGAVVSQFGLDGIAALLFPPSASSKAPQPHPLTGVCDPKIGFGPGEPLCKQCLDEKRTDCYGPQRFDCRANVSDTAVRQNISGLLQKAVDLQKKIEADRKKDEEFIVTNIKAGRCRAVVDYLTPRVKELEKVSDKEHRDALDSALECLTDRHAKARDAAKKYTDPLHVEIVMKEVNALGEAVQDLEKKIRNFNFDVRAKEALGRYRGHISFCNDRLQH